MVKKKIIKKKIVKKKTVVKKTPIVKKEEPVELKEYNSKKLKKIQEFLDMINRNKEGIIIIVVIIYVIKILFGGD